MYRQRRITLKATYRFNKQVVNKSYNYNCWVIPLRRAVMKLSSESLVEAILSGKVNNGERITVGINEQNNPIGVIYR